MAQKGCRYCGRWFHRHTPQQKACREEECRRARRREKLRSWRKRHPGQAEKFLPKVRAWAESYPHYWQQWRAGNSQYREREKQRMRAKRRQARRVAKETGTREILVEKLRTVCAAEPETVANDTGRDRRVDALVEVLIWKESVANRNRIGTEASSAG
jgi:hypothetical protein